MEPSNLGEALQGAAAEQPCAVSPDMLLPERWERQTLAPGINKPTNVRYGTSKLGVAHG